MIRTEEAREILEVTNKFNLHIFDKLQNLDKLGEGKGNIQEQMNTYKGPQNNLVLGTAGFLHKTTTC